MGNKEQLLPDRATEDVPYEERTSMRLLTDFSPALCSSKEQPNCNLAPGVTKKISDFLPILFCCGSVGTYNI
jgi:hypothetical protein